MPHHYELVSAALRAEKAVYCEWPLANGVKQAEALANLARDVGVVARVGLQARSSPAINYVRALVADGYVGKVLSSSIIASGLNWGADVRRCYLYLHDKKNGASMLTIPFGHTTDAFCWCLGEFSELSATFATRRRVVRVSDDGTMCQSDIADQVSVTGTLESGAVASIHFHGGLSRGVGFLWEIHGTEGDLLIEGPNGHVQMMPLVVKGGRGDEARVRDLPIPSSYRWTPHGTPEGVPFNLAPAYIRLAEDLTSRRETAPTFGNAVVRHRMIEAIAKAAKTGTRQSYDARWR